MFDSRDPLLDARADAELDLHGLGAIAARSAVRAFLEGWRRRKAGAVIRAAGSVVGMCGDCSVIFRHDGPGMRILV